MGMKGWKAAATLAMVLLAAGAFAEETRARITDNIEGVLTEEGDLMLVVRAHRGDAWSRLARRVTGDGANWRRLAEINGAGENLLAGQRVRVPWTWVRDELKAAVVEEIFPHDGRVADGWIHQVTFDRTFEGETLWEIARWFTGDGRNYSEIRSANPGLAMSTRVGERILIPRRFLLPAFANAPLSAVDGPDYRVIQMGRDAAESALLEYGADANGSWAEYRLKEGEAIYSSVAIRFTGRVHADDVNQAVSRIIELNRIEDVSRLPVGYRVRIPLELVTAEYRPPGDPLRIAWEREERERMLLVDRPRAARLEGVQIVIDPGHGGRDVGASRGDLWESSYVYDIACRVRDYAERESGAKVWITTRSKSLGFTPALDDTVRNVKDHILLTNPVYDLDNPVIGVNLRWYLANAIFSNAVSGGTSPDKVVFISLHADSLHPSLRGAMAYVPGQRHVTGTFGKREDVYLARAEVRQNPVVTQTAEEARTAEALSRRMAESILGAFAEANLPVHPYGAVRGHVVRGGGEWVPAVIRHNTIPTRVLLEVANLGNPDDHSLLGSRKSRDRIARAIFSGIESYFDSEVEERSLIAGTTAAGAGTR